MQRLSVFDFRDGKELRARLADISRCLEKMQHESTVRHEALSASIIDEGPYRTANLRPDPPAGSGHEAVLHAIADAIRLTNAKFQPGADFDSFEYERSVQAIIDLYRTVVRPPRKRWFRDDGDVPLPVAFGVLGLIAIAIATFLSFR